jgi:hypothetical protein
LTRACIASISCPTRVFRRLAARLRQQHGYSRTTPFLARGARTAELLPCNQMRNHKRWQDDISVGSRWRTDGKTGASFETVAFESFQASRRRLFVQPIQAARPAPWLCFARSRHSPCQLHPDMRVVRFANKEGRSGACGRNFRTGINRRLARSPR